MFPLHVASHSTMYLWRRGHPNTPTRPTPHPVPSFTPPNEPTANATKKRKATSTDDSAPKRRNLNEAGIPEPPPPVGGKARSKAKLPAPNPQAGGSSTDAGTQSVNKKGIRGGRQAKQELIDEADSLLRGETVPIPKRATRRITRANRG
ncbi:hypothetical protein B0J17DRAFT_631949 [Rhizoctonia solani]|nr:hypothetical protein B0J17DRAFT_631949 [Rhizoctonia solani]